MPFNVKIPLNDAFLLQNKENKNTFWTQHPKKGAGTQTVANMATRTYQQAVTLIFTRSILSDSAL